MAPRWPTCRVPGCGQRSMAVYRRRQRGPDGVLQSTRTRGLCAQHDHQLRSLWDKIWAILEARDQVPGATAQDALLLTDPEAWVDQQLRGSVL